MANIGAAPAGTRLTWSSDTTVVRGGFIICFDAIVPFPPSPPPAPPRPPSPPPVPPRRPPPSPPPRPPPPPSSPPPPPAAPYDCGQLFCVTSGQEFCQTTGHNATGRGPRQCVWDGDGTYGNSERCTIQTIYASAISAVFYNVEASYDYMRITYPATTRAPPMNDVTASGYAPGICPGAPGAPGTSCANCALGGSCSGTQSGIAAFNAMANISVAPAGTRLTWSSDSLGVRGGFIICFDAIVPFPPSPPPAPPRPPSSPPVARCCHNYRRHPTRTALGLGQ
jgi:hypothetical protein